MHNVWQDLRFASRTAAQQRIAAPACRAARLDPMNTLREQ
jgi:hypothetical protein